MLSFGLPAFPDRDTFGAFVVAVVGEIFDKVSFGNQVRTAVVERAKLLFLDELVEAVFTDGRETACFHGS